MHLLYVTEDVPNRDPVLGDGSSMIPFELVRAFPAEVRVTLLTFDSGVPVPPEVRERCEQVVVLPLDEAAGGRLRGGRLHGLLRTDDVAGTARTSARALAEVAARSTAADATLLHGPHVLPLARAVVGPLVAQTVDPWSTALRMVADRSSGARRLYWLRRVRAAVAAERRLPRDARLLTVGAADARTWSATVGRPVRAVPNGVEHQPRSRRGTGAPVVCFLGSLDYLPNVDSVQRLVQDIAPLVWAEDPSARFLVAGRLPVPEVLALGGARVEVRANVATVGEVFDDADLAVFPDRYGVGVRNSVQEALAAGVPVVASSSAARELPAHPLLHVHDEDREIAAAALALLHGPRASPDLPAQAVRSWGEAAADYLAELGRAVAGR